MCLVSGGIGPPSFLLLKREETPGLPTPRTVGQEMDNPQRTQRSKNSRHEPKGFLVTLIMLAGNGPWGDQSQSHWL